MRRALATRDIATVFRLLQRYGVSQRRIAAFTGQSQSEISEILGGRRVVSYEVLVRIAEGLDVPRGHLGLAHDDGTAQVLDVAAGEVPVAVAGAGAARLTSCSQSAPGLGGRESGERRGSAVVVNERDDTEVVEVIPVTDVGEVAAAHTLGPVISGANG